MILDVARREDARDVRPRRSRLGDEVTLLVVVEPGQKSIQVGEKLATMAKQLNIKKVLAVVNKANGESEARVVTEQMKGKGIDVLGSIPASRGAIEADMKGVPLLDDVPGDAAVDAIKRVLDSIITQFYS